MPVGGHLRSIEDAMGAMRSLHEMLVQRFVELHGPSACDTLAHETEELRGEILRELAERRATSAANHHLTPAHRDLGEDEYDPDDVEEVPIRDAAGAPTGSFRPKLFAPPLPSALLEKIEIVRASHHTDGTACIVCQEDICYGQKLCKLPVCGHQLCSQCGYQWLAICGSCPVCRRVITLADFDEGSSCADDFSSEGFILSAGSSMVSSNAGMVSLPSRQHGVAISQQQHVPPHLSMPLDIVIPTASSDAHRTSVHDHAFEPAAQERATSPLLQARPTLPRPASCSRVPRTQPSALPTDSPAPFSTHSVPLQRPASSSVASLRQRVASAAAAIQPAPAIVASSRHVGTAYEVFSLPDRGWIEPKSTLTRPSSAPLSHQRVVLTAPQPRNAFITPSIAPSSILGEAVRFSISPAPLNRSPLVLAPSVQLYPSSKEPPRGVLLPTSNRPAPVLLPGRPGVASRPSSANVHSTVASSTVAAAAMSSAHRVVVAAKERPPSGALRRSPSATALAAKRSSSAKASYGAQMRLQRHGGPMTLTIDGTSLSRSHMV